MKPLIYNSPTYGNLAIIPYPPAGDAQETLEFFTDVLNSYTGETETRNKMRALPRHSIQYTYAHRYELTQGVFNTSYSTVRGKWAIPFWTEAQRITVTSGQTVYALDTTVHDIRVGGMLLLYTLARDWEVLDVSAVTATTATATATTLTGTVYAVPVRVGYIDGDITLAPTGYDSGMKATFNIDDVLAGLGTTEPTQYSGLDLYTDPYLIDGKGSTTISMLERKIDYSVGTFAHSTPWVGARYAKQYQMDGSGAADIRTLKDFFYRRSGKMRAFISPSFESNLRKTSTGAVTSTFKFADDGFYAQASVERKTLAFQLDDGTWQLRQASAPTLIGDGNTQVTLDSALNVDASRIMLVSYAGVNRLDTDRLEINHRTAGYFTSSYQVMELTP